MEKDVNQTNIEAFDLEIESTDTPEIRHEIAEKSDSFPPQKITNPPETNRKEPADASPSTEQSKEDADQENADLQMQTRIAELEQQLEQSQTRRQETGKRLLATQKSLAEAVSRYRAMLLESMPEAPESLVAGATVNEVDRSFAEAKALVHQVRREVEEKLARERLPAGSPTRGPADFAALTPMEKIRSALSR